MEDVFPGNLRDLVNRAISFGLNGRQVDALVAAHGINVLDPAKPVPALAVQLSGPPAFELLAEGGKTGGVMFNGITRFVSIVPPKPNAFPLARVYHLPVRDLFEFSRIGRAFEERGISVGPLLSEAFYAALEADGHEQRIADYCAAYGRWTKAFAGLIAGRVSSTFVEHGIIFCSKGCMLCGRDASLLMTTTVGDSEGGGTMLGFYACPEHAAEANDDASYFHFLCRSFGHPSPTLVGRPSMEFLVEGAADFLTTQLNCRIVKIRGGTITARRSSGYRIIVRFGEDGDYAYMIFDTNGKEVARIDTANHHDVAYGPDHLHLTLGKIANHVVPSFTYGFLPADAQMIRRILEEHGG